MRAPRRRRQIFAVLPDEAGERVLAVRGAGGWTLPGWISYTIGNWRNVGWVNRAVARRFGLTVTTLRPLGVEAEGDYWRRGYYELENHEPGRSAPAGSRWLPAEDLHFEDERDRAAVGRWLAERSLPPHRLTPPWVHRGWIEQTSGWLDRMLEGLDRPRTGPVEQLASLSISCVLRAPTAAGDVYLKAAAKVFAGEPALTQALSSHHDGAVPHVLAIDVRRRLLLMDDFGGRHLWEVAQPRPWLRTFELLASLQRAWVGRTDELRALGCPDRGLDRLDEEIVSLLGNKDALRLGEEDGLTEAKAARLPELEGALRQASARLHAYDVPPTLVHGDFHAANVQVRDGEPLIYDWSDACVSHPFFEVVPFFDFLEERLPVKRNRLRAAYLRAWARDSQLGKAFELAQYVGLFHQAISYHRLTLGTEPRSRGEWGNVVPYFVRKLLEAQPG